MADFKELFYADSIPKNLLVVYRHNNANYTLRNSDFRGNMELSQTICTEQTLRFGCPAPAEFKITVNGKNDIPFVGKELTVSMVLNNDTQDPYSLGKYRVATETLSSDRKSKTLVAYDRLHTIFNTNCAEWYNRLLPYDDSTVTFLNFCTSFFTYFNIPVLNLPNNNNDKVIRKTIKPSELSGKDVLSAICEFSARFCMITYDNKIDFFTINNAVSENIDKSKYITTAWEDYNVEPITKVQIQNAEDDIGGSYGTGTNVYVIKDNFLCYGMSQNELDAVAQAIYQSASLITYRPINLSMRGNPELLPGSKISVTTDNEVLNSFIISRKLKGIQALRDVLTAEGTRTQPEVSNSIGRSIVQLKGKTNQLERNINETRSTITDVESGLQSQITQNASGISAEVSRATEEEGKLSNRITATETTFGVKIEQIQKELDGDIITYNVDKAPTLRNYPAYNFTNNIRVGETFILNPGLKFQYNDETYSKYARSVAFNTTTMETYKFMKNENDVWYWKQVADSDFGLAMQKISELEVTTDSISTTVAENKRTSDGQYSELSSSIEQTNSSIEAEVSRATSEEGKISSRIAIEADRITAEVNRATTEEGSLSSRITQTADSITSEVTRATKEEGKLSTRITQTSNSIDLEVSRATSAESNLLSRISVTENAIVSEVARAGAAEDRLGSIIDQQATQISAKVSRSGGNDASFAWVLDANGFKLVSKYDDVFICNANGIIVKGYTKTEELNALSLTVKGKASIEQLSAVDGKIDDLSSIAITTQNLSAQNINASQITAGKISVDRLDIGAIVNVNTISSALNDANQGTIRIGNVYAGSYYYFTGSGYTRLGAIDVIGIDGKSHKVLGW